ncbi:MAG: M56 family metallopeptidase, partial [Clostridium sp.]
MDYLKIFDVVIELSITGSILAVLILLIRQLLKKNISKNIIYYIWVILLVKLLVPFGPESNLSLYNLFDNESKTVSSNNNTKNLSNNNIDINKNPIISQTNENSNSNILANDKLENNNSTTDKSNLKIPKTSIKEVAFYIWIIGILALIGYTLLNYIKFKRNTLKNSEDKILRQEINAILNQSLGRLSIKRNIEIIISKNINSPTFYGIINPKIVLPLKVVENSSSEELKYILLHELCHYKRKDIIVAWVITLVKIIYWFNPIILISLNIMRKDCETSCDEMVLNYLEKNENLKYGNTILNVIQYVNEEKYIAGTTSMVNNKKDLKERITNIAKNKKLGIKTIIGGVLIILVIGGIGLTNKISSKTINLSINS